MIPNDNTKGSKERLQARMLNTSVPINKNIFGARRKGAFVEGSNINLTRFLLRGINMMIKFSCLLTRK